MTPTPDNITMSEELLTKKFFQSENFGLILLSIVGNSQNPSSNLVLRKCAAITLENNVKTGWLSITKDQKSPHFFSEAAKDLVKQNILQSMISCEDISLIKILSASLHQILIRDFPHKWPGFESEIETHLKSQQSAEGLYPLLSAYNSFAKTRTSYIGDDREPISESNKTILPILENFMQGILVEKNVPVEIINSLTKKIFIILRNITKGDLDTYMRTFKNNDKWMAYLLQVLSDFDSA